MSSRWTWKHAVVAVALLGSVGYGVRSLHQRALAAPEAVQATDDQNLEPYPLPDGEPDKLFEFVEKLRGNDKDFDTPQEEREHQQRLMLTAVAVADRILDRLELSDEDAEKAAQLKVQSYVNLAVLAEPDPKPAKRAIEKVLELQKSERKIVAEFAQNNQQLVRIICVAGLSPEDRDKLSAEVLSDVHQRKFSPGVMRKAQMLGETLGEAGDRDRMVGYYGKLAVAMRESGIEVLVAQAEQIEGQLRRIKLPGNVMELEGATLTGKKFDWASYRGKVVLVDYWATWCGPCRQELPNVKKAYKKYHDRGFEVVGISLDDDPDKLQTFLEDQKIPWVTLFEPEEQHRGWKHPMAVHYGISAIPMAILVGKDGKVVSMSARGPELSQMLEELLSEKK